MLPVLVVKPKKQVVVNRDMGFAECPERIVLGDGTSCCVFNALNYAAGREVLTRQKVLHIAMHELNIKMPSMVWPNQEPLLENFDANYNRFPDVHKLVTYWFCCHNNYAQVHDEVYGMLLRQPELMFEDLKVNCCLSCRS